MTAGWWSQPFAEEGSATAEGIVNQLGRPALKELTVLVREAAQNSWDAKSGDHDVHFTVNLRRLGGNSTEWKNVLLPGAGGILAENLAHSLTDDAVVITISDRFTRGLGGPLRAGSKPKAGERSDFVQFLRNVGEARDHAFGGGTYGFGKGIFYRLSKCASILVDSYTGDGSVAERRLMGAALANSFYDEDDRRFTGRHWWGVDVNGIPDPLLGKDAVAVATSLGLPGFADGISGTDIVVIGALLDSNDDEMSELSEPQSLMEAANFMASSILWNLWPKMVPQDGTPRMLFRVAVEGVDIAIPDPMTCVDLAPFARSLIDVREGRSTKYTRTKAPKLAGELSISLAPNVELEKSAVVRSARPFVGPSHHVARMRLAELVVDYYPGPTHPDELVRYGGVFRSVAESDSHFAESEPPTHDDWVSSGLTGVSKGVVQNSRQFLNRELGRHFGPAPLSSTTGQAGLGRLASRLSRLNPTLRSGGAGPTAGTSGGPQGGSGGTRRSNRSPRIVDQARLKVFNGIPYVVARVALPGGLDESIFSATVNVILDGGSRESQLFAGANVPEIIQWQPVQKGPAVHGPILTSMSLEDSEWWVYASYVPDAVVRVEVKRVSGEL
jgi:hypothetical protein